MNRVIEKLKFLNLKITVFLFSVCIYKQKKMP